MGKLEHRCSHCHALHWLDERKKGSPLSNPRYGQCCLEGKVSIDYVEPLPPPLYWYFASVHEDAKRFRKYIRRYNKAFAFTSSGGPGHLDGSVLDGRGPPCYKIQGELFHRIGAIHPDDGRSPIYSQLYVYDPQEALGYRNANNSDTLPTTMEDLQNIILGCNPFVALYDQASALTRSVSGSLPEYRLRLDFLRATDRHRYNLPSSQYELAAIIPGDVDSCVNSRDIIVRAKGGALLRMTEIHPFYIALHFPLLAPTGQAGWSPLLRYTFLPSKSRKSGAHEFLSFCDFLKHRLHIRPEEFESDHYFRAGFLLQEFIVDMWAAAEHSRLEWIRNNQKSIRAELYSGLMDALREGLEPSSIGCKVILPSSFTSGPRFMQKKLQDALALLRIFKGSDLFITVTANPAWAEVQEALLPGQVPSDRPDIVARVFRLKVQALIEDITKRHIFGEAVAYVYTVEYQKRGLPHVHLIVFLHPEARLSTPERVDKFISTEFPDEFTNPELFDLVKTHMIHGPCGASNFSSCLNEKKECTKGFPMPFQPETDISGDTYVKTRRRDTGKSYRVRDTIVDNRNVVSYSPVLLARYKAHINVECTSGFNAIKYIYKVCPTSGCTANALIGSLKYIYKGPDRATVAVESDCKSAPRARDEIRLYLDARYVSASEAYARIMGWATHCVCVFVRNPFLSCPHYSSLTRNILPSNNYKCTSSTNNG